MELEKILSQLSGVRKSQAGFIARCPAHDDDKQSLAVGRTADRILFNCFAGCTVEQILNALGLEWKDLFQNDPKPFPKTHSSGGVAYFASSSAKLKTVYPYTDENGKLLYENVRFEPKDFRQTAVRP